MKKLGIAIDVDEVLVAGAGPILAHLNTLYGRAFTLEGMNEGFMRFVARAFAPDGTEAELVREIEAFIISDDYARQPPIKGSVQVVHALAERYRLLALTHRPAVQIESTHTWINGWFSGVFEEIAVLNTGIFGHNEYAAQSKAGYCSAHDIRFLIDDKLSVCQDMNDKGGQAILFGEYPWNQADKLHSGVVQCKDWQAVLEYFDGQR